MKSMGHSLLFYFFIRQFISHGIDFGEFDKLNPVLEDGR